MSERPFRFKIASAPKFFFGAVCYVLGAILFYFIYPLPAVGVAVLIFAAAFMSWNTTLKGGPQTAFVLGLGFGFNIGLFCLSLVLISGLTEGDWVSPLIAIAFCVVVIGGSTWLICRALAKADADTSVHSPEEVAAKLRRGFLLSMWGLDLLIGCIVLMLVLCFCVDSLALDVALPTICVIVGFILFFVGRMQVGMQTRYLNAINRQRTPLEEWTLSAMQGVESAALKANLANQVARAVPGVADDALVAAQSGKIAAGFFGVGTVYTGRNVLKNHWPAVALAVSCALVILVHCL